MSVDVRHLLQCRKAVDSRDTREPIGGIWLTPSTMKCLAILGHSVEFWKKHTVDKAVGVSAGLTSADFGFGKECVIPDKSLPVNETLGLAYGISKNLPECRNVASWLNFRLETSR